MKISLETPAFAAGGLIPKRHSGDGENKSPALRWSEPPEGTKSFVLIMDDPDAPTGTFVHWVLYDIPANVRGLPEGITRMPTLVNIGTHGMNDYHKLGYDGPCPPRGQQHRYNIKLFALNVTLNLPAGMKAPQVEKMIVESRLLATGSIAARYQR